MEFNEKQNEITAKLAKGWNTWDVHSVAAHVYLPQKLRLNIAFVVPHMSAYCGACLWKNVESFGEHSVDGSYTEANLRYLDGIYNVRTAASGAELVIKITPVKPRYNIYIMLEASPVWGSKINITYSGDNLCAECVTANSGNKNSDIKNFTIETLNPTDEPSYNPCTCAHIACKADEPLYFRVNNKLNKAEIDQRLDSAKADWLRTTISADGILGVGLDAMRRSLLWNTIYDPHGNRVITPVSRDWCDPGRTKTFPVNRLGHFVIFGWDTFFASLQLGLISRELAYSNVFAILQGQTPEGMIPFQASANGRTLDRAAPHVGSLCVWKLFMQYGDKWFIEACFDRLLAFNRWRFRERDFNGDGLFEPASVPWAPIKNDDEVMKTPQFNPKYSACLETGLDNSPMWDRAVYDTEKHCLQLSYIGLCSELVFDCEMLEKMAALLGRKSEQDELAGRRIALAARINSQLYNNQIHFYLNKHWDGRFDPCLSITGFYPLTAGIVPSGELEFILNNHLLNPNEFWGDYVIPSVSRNDPGFADQQYWRGRIWAPTNFLAGEGIMRIGRIDILDELVKKGLNLFVDCWRKYGAVGENYNAVTGETAEPDKWSDRFYHWGALLVYMAVQRIVNFNEWKDTVEYNKVPQWLSAVRNVPVGNKMFDAG
ncbi:MAG: hypothetical protein FWD78_08940 [Treponema sp.]|nr:hypothetical protein [Treponema sp.]